MSLQHATYDHNRQWSTVHRQRTRYVLHRPRHQTVTSSIEYPQTNGQAEAANKVILVELCKRLDSTKGRWPEDLLEVLWAYQCTPQSATNESHFSLVYGAEVMILVEIGEPSLCRELYDLDQNHQNMCTHLDLLPELRDKAQIRNLAATQRAARKYKANLCPRSFAKGDLVWRMASSARRKDGKFSANWDGPYQIRDDARGDAYKLEQLSREEILNTWNVSHLKFYFS